jgi:ferrous iron transport protein A
MSIDSDIAQTRIGVSCEAGPVNLDPPLPLECLRPGEWADVAEVTGEPGWVARLADLGVRTGCRLLLLQPGWPCLLQMGGSRLSLRGEEGTRILVRPVTG